MATAKKTTKKAAKSADKSDAFAVIKTGGKQYKVSEGDTITIEKMKGEFKAGDKVTFDQVLLTGSGDEFNFGAPTISGSAVEGEIASIGRNQKVIVIKYKQKSRYFKKNGHRQPHFKVKITKVA
jgi:large subunit ribosomal protein L21